MKSILKQKENILSKKKHFVQKFKKYKTTKESYLSNVYLLKQKYIFFIQKRRSFVLT